MAAYDEIQHDPVTTPPDISRLPREAALEAIKDWFLGNFEDPVHSTPYESAEGGYQYIWGGPYETRDIIETFFADVASEDWIKGVIDELERETDVWVPNSNRLQPPDEDHEPPGGPDVRELHSEMQRRTVALEEALARVPQLPPGIGHNRPPEPLDLEPLDEDDRAEIATALRVLKDQPIEPADNGSAAAEALARFETKREKLGKWLAQQGSIFTAEAVKEAGKQFGKWAPTAFWLWLMDHMFGVSQAVSAWLKVVHLPF